MNIYNKTSSSQIDNTSGGRGFTVGTNQALGGGQIASWDSSQFYLTITVITDSADQIWGGIITMA